MRSALDQCRAAMRDAMGLPADETIELAFVEGLPWDGPYLRADAQCVARWRELLASDAARLGASRLRVGLVWAGRPQQWDDRKRSISLAMLAPLS